MVNQHMQKNGKNCDPDNRVILSSDKIREELFGDESIQGDPRLVFDLLDSRLSGNLADGKDIVIDATNICKRDRASYFEIAKFHNATVTGIVFDIPVVTCMERNKNRNRVVPDHVYIKMLEKYQDPTLDEGFTVIIKEVES